MHHKFPQSSVILRVFALILTCLFFGVAAMAQDKPSVVPPSAPAQAAEKSTAEAKTIGGSPNSVNDYKASLNSLSTLYQSDVQRLEKQNSQAKDLYNQGLISRVELEKIDKSLADGRAKVDEIAGQIAEADKPAPSASTNDASALSVSNQAWSTGNARVDGLIRLYGNQYGVDPYLIY